MTWQTIAELPFQRADVKGTKFLVPIKEISLANDTIDAKVRDENGKLSLRFENPRHGGLFKNVISPAGLDRGSIEQLRLQIAEEGLNSPLICRLYDGKIQVVDGERRFRAIQLLINDPSALVYDQHSGEKIPANVALSEIECHIRMMSDLDAYRCANGTDATSVSHNENSLVVLVKYLLDCGVADADILRATAKSKAWLGRTKNLVTELDDKTLQKLATGKLSVTGAAYAVKEKDLDLRQEIVDSMIRTADEEYEHSVRAAEEAVQRKKEQLGVAKSLAALGEPGADVAAAEEDIKTAEAERDRLQSEPRSGANRRHAKRGGGGSRAGQGALANNGLTAAKMKNKWFKEADNWLGLEERPHADDVDEEDVRLVRDLGKHCENNVEDIFRILKAHKRWKARKK